MSERIQGLSISLDLETAGVDRSLSQIKNSFQSLRRSAQVNMNNMKFDSKDLTTYKKNLDNLTDSYERQEQNVDDIAKRMERMKDAGDENSESFKRLNAEYNKQVDELNKLGHALDRAQEGLRDVYNESSRLTQLGNTFSNIGSSLQDVGSRIQGVGTQIQSVGRGLTRSITMPALGAVTAIGGITAAFGWGRLTSLDSAQAQLRGLGYDTEDVGRISEQVTSAIEGGMTTMGEGVSIAAGAMAAGVEEGAELERFIKLVGDAAVGANRPVNEMATIFNRVQGQGKLMTQELNQVEDGLPGFSLAMAEHMGIGLEEFRKMVTAGEVSSDDFLTVMDNFAGDMASAYSESWEGMLANTKAYVGIIGENLLGGVFEQSKESIAEFIEFLKSDEVVAWAERAGESIGSAFSNIVDSVKSGIDWFMNLGSEKQKLIGIMSAVAVAAGPVLTVFGGLVVGIGSVVKTLGGLFGGLGSLFKWFGSISGGIKMIVKEGAKFAKVFPKIGAVVKGLGVAFKVLTGPVGLAIAAIVGIGAAFVTAYRRSETFRGFIHDIGGMLKGAWESVVEFGDNVKTAFEGVFAMFRGDTDSGIDLLRSIGLSDDTIETIYNTTQKIQRQFYIMRNKISEALATVRAFFVEQFDGIKSWWDSDGEMIMSAVSTSFEWGMGVVKNVVDMGITFVQDLFQRFAPIVEGIFNVLWPTIVYLTQTAWEKIKLAIGIAMDLVQGIISGVSAIIEGDWYRFGEILKETTLSIRDRVVEFIGNMRDRALELFNNLTGGGIDKFKEMRDGVIEWVLNLIERALFEWERLKIRTEYFIRLMVHNVKQFFIDLWENVTNKVSEIRDGVVERFTQLKDRVIEKVDEIFGPTIQTFQDIYNSVTSKAEEIRVTLTEIWDRIKEIITTAVRITYERVRDRFLEMYNNVTERMNNLRTRLNEIWTAIRTRITEVITSLYNRVRDWFLNIYNNVNNRTQNTRNRVTELWNNLRDRVVNTVRNLYNRVRDWFLSIYNNVRDRVISIRNTAVNWFERMRNRVVSVVKNLWERVSGWFSSIYTAIHDKMRDAKNKAVGFAEDLYTGAKEQFDKLVTGASNMMTGIGNAIDNLRSNVISKAKSLGTGIANAAIDGFNGLIKGINWVADKLGAPKISLISRIGGSGGSIGAGNGYRAIRASKGLKNHKGGDVLVGDKGPGNSVGGGSSTREIVQLPDGKNFLMDGDVLLPNAPKGMKVHRNKDTEAILASNPDWNPDLTGGSGVMNNINSWMGRQLGRATASSVGTYQDVNRSVATGLAKTTVTGAKIYEDVLDYADNPMKLFTDILDKYVGFDMPEYPLELATRGIDHLKDSAVDKFKSWFEDFGSGGDGSHILGESLLQPFGRYIGGIQFNGGRHYGIDTAHKFDPLLSPVNGKVSRVWNDYGGGNSLQITTDKYIWWFMHLSNIMKSVGDTVRAGMRLGTTGNSGNYVVGSGHLHTQVHPRSKGAGNFNAIDPLPVLKGLSGHKLGGYIQRGGLFNLHDDEFVINPNHPTEAMKLIALAGKKLAGKSKQTRELPNSTGGNKNHEEMMMKMQQQIDLLTQLVTSNKAIENKDYQPEININDLNKKQNRFNDDRTILI